MAHISEDRVRETTSTTGTGAVSLAGAVTGFRSFSSVMGPSDTCYYAIVDNATGAWETGLGTYSLNTITRTTILRSSNANAAVNFAAGTKDVYMTLVATDTPIFQPDNTIILPGVSTSAEPSAPASDTLKFYAKNVSGRMMPKIIGPSGVDTMLQPFIGSNRIVIFQPQTGTTGTGGGLGPAWTAGGTVNHPTPSNTAPARSNSMKRTRYVNVVTTQNQTLGVRYNSASEQMFWRGSSAGLGGFFFYTRFIVELWPAATVRLFAGLASTASTSVVASDTVINNTCGLWHDTTDPATGAGAFNFVTRDTATTTKQQITLSNAIAAGNSYDFTMFCAPNGSTIYWRLVDLVNDVTYSGSQTTTLPASTAFMQPQVQMSNGTANTVVTTTGIGIVSIYVESDF